MPIWIARLILKNILGSDETKRLCMNALRDLAAKSETTIDDTAVTVIDEAWDVIVPILIGKV